MVGEIKKYQVRIKELEDQLNSTQRDSQQNIIFEQEIEAWKLKFSDAQNAHQNELLDIRQRLEAFLADRLVILIKKIMNEV